MSKHQSTDHQIGGSHYQVRGVQHVVFCQRNRIPWCEANALKYLVRWRKKNGVEDLRKARHYLELCCEIDYINGKVNPTGMRLNGLHPSADELIKDNAVPEPEASIIKLILSHQTKYGESTLRTALKELDKLIAANEKQQSAAAMLE